MARRHLDESNNSSVPTLDEYYAQRAAEEQEQYYLQGSRNRKESYPLKEVVQYSDEDEKEARSVINRYVSELSKFTGMTDGEILDRINNGTLYGIDALNGKYDGAVRRIEAATNDIINKPSYIKYLANCIATATSNNPNKGHFVTGNQTFAANPSKYGFKKVTKDEAKPGSLVQIVDRIPVHAMILNSKNGDNMTFNYSPGDYPDYKINAKYPMWDNTRYDYYNFVGNEADSARWKKEYQERYSQKFGGCIGRRHLATGGSVKNRHKAELGTKVLKEVVITPQRQNVYNSDFVDYIRKDLQDALMARIFDRFSGYKQLKNKLRGRNLNFLI